MRVKSIDSFSCDRTRIVSTVLVSIAHGSTSERGDLLLNSSTAWAIKVYLAFGSSRFVPKVGFTNALLVSMMSPLAFATSSAI
jgi:hypothetical protein